MDVATTTVGLVQTRIQHRERHHARVAVVERRYFWTWVGHLPECAEYRRRSGDDVDAGSLGEAGQEPSHDLDDGVDFVVGDELEVAYGLQGHISFQVERGMGVLPTITPWLGPRIGRRLMTVPGLLLLETFPQLADSSLASSPNQSRDLSIQLSGWMLLEADYQLTSAGH